MSCRGHKCVINLLNLSAASLPSELHRKKKDQNWEGNILWGCKTCNVEYYTCGTPCVLLRMAEVDSVTCKTFSYWPSSSCIKSGHVTNQYCLTLECVGVLKHKCLCICIHSKCWWEGRSYYLRSYHCISLLLVFHVC